jgi:hypothetical protein
LAAPVLCPGGANIKPPFEMGVANMIYKTNIAKMEEKY